ncbi:MAG: hypothetical protein ACP5PM_10535 [Acidimicrobiales bacterium]
MCAHSIDDSKAMQTITARDFGPSADVVEVAKVLAPVVNIDNGCCTLSEVVVQADLEQLADSGAGA